MGSHYKIEVDIYERESGPSMQFFCDVIAKALEEEGYSERVYDILVKGPPELSFKVVMK